MEMTYSEPQTPLFPPPYVNLVNAKDHWKLGESEHNTDCDVTVGITNSYVPNICIYSLPSLSAWYSTTLLYCCIVIAFMAFYSKCTPQLKLNSLV